jgi:putative membrane protein
MKAVIANDRKANEYLANERTFLAWVRTGVAVMSLGFVVAKFGLWLRELSAGLMSHAPVRASGVSAPMGMGMIAFGALAILLAAWRYRRVNRQIDAGLVEPDHGLVALVTAALTVLALAMIIYIASATLGR